MGLAGQALGEFIQQLLLALVFQRPRFVDIALHQLAQPLDPGVRLLPAVAGLFEVVLVPLQALALLVDEARALEDKREQKLLDELSQRLPRQSQY